MNADGTVLEMQNVSKSFEAPFGRITVLRHIDISAKRGEFIVITGPSGSGKSTFLHLAALLDHPSTGNVFFADRDVSLLDDGELCDLRKTQIGIVFQKYHLLPHRSVLDNVKFRFRYIDCDQAYVTSRIEQSLALMDLTGIAHQPVRLLSGGEMQRVAIARAVAVEPRLLIADEPTGNLDLHSTKMVMDCFHKLNQSGITILMVTHDKALVEFCSRSLNCEDGIIACEQS